MTNISNNKTADVNDLRSSLKHQLSDKEPVEIINELDAKIEEMSEYDFDAELVKGYLAVLQEKTPLAMEDFDAEQSFMEFREKYALQYEYAISESPAPPKQQAPKRRFRFAGALAATVVACLVLIMLFVPTDAYGNRFFTRIVHWGEEVLTFRALPPGGVMEFPADSDAEYRSIADALEQNGISSANCPTWIPTGFSLVEIDFAESDLSMGFVAVYQNDEDIVHLFIQYHSNPSIDISVEKDLGGNIYTSKGFEYYILENMTIAKAVWTDDNAIYQISGDIPLGDLKLMLDSIHGRR